MPGTSRLGKPAWAVAVLLASLGLAGCAQGAAGPDSAHRGPVIQGGPYVVRVSQPPTMVHVPAAPVRQDRGQPRRAHYR
jgi:hypothetical protein